MAGCGVAFKLATALLETIPTEMLDLVAIGTIADMVSLTDENRIMVKVGLEILKTTERIGLQELLRISDVDPTTISEETVGFKLAPQLNALGRLDDPNPAIELLTMRKLKPLLWKSMLKMKNVRKLFKKSLMKP